ncbi:Hypothetical protein RG1141_CH07390 [Neorhizobium galegae bv. officinalis bv. officinalis str. HAMBI 1141]|uniref:Uncharacterized protein n=1 Tax=Neorhizobium galegae bv. officinalis bv. officinalis str. HAMBI 1141 TaxID=1028801 RepID=A0A068T4S6_NEOGA|nr:MULTISPECIES: hypothetical protein [Neorhizobium]MCJ9674617.1 hypothetical protein [Neorhizobium sp. SHOUNA12B]MCJ9747536.1 hypothetical protein [Neorhizobium sp. SHOUNA12A]MCJ9754778.1 hypothetical protein [Neorhizobium sp. BETTINA12A]CDN53099.1 Hypothetical protein RG1141_CH07390 [Neorhizobium galegae bv. officinalis bv. officinalis str. HAMBI 1141]
MNDQLNEIIARIRAEVAAGSADRSHVAMSMEDLLLLVQNFESLRSEREELRRRAELHADVIEAVRVFMEAYRDKYKNYGSGGVRPSAVLRHEVWRVYAAMRGLPIANDSMF